MEQGKVSLGVLYLLFLDIEFHLLYHSFYLIFIGGEEGSGFICTSHASRQSRV